MQFDHGESPKGTWPSRFEIASSHWDSQWHSHLVMNRIKTFFEMIKFEHSVFALPFAYLGMVLAALGMPAPATLLWVTLAMISMRTAAMALNRLIDHAIDAENPRTKSRALPAGLLTRRSVWAAAILSAGIFFFSAFRLNGLCFMLAPVPLILVCVYPYLKRWTWVSHWVLGFILGIAPFGGWLAVKPEWSWIPAWLTVAVTSWVGGFDIFYSLQDAAFDCAKGLKSLPARFGTERAILIGKLSQALTVLSLAAAGLLASLSNFFWIGLGLVSLFLWREHRLVSRYGLSKIDEAFFNMNAWVSIVVFASVFFDLMV